MLKSGQNFAHFEILSKLGEGGMGAVFLARDTKLDRRVALKVLTGEMFDDESKLERFRREARTAAQISNAYVMSTYDIGTAKAEGSDQEINYIVLEYVEGRPLAEYIKEDRPTLQVLVRLGEKIASGLAAAHKLNIVHRDIKPDNILIDESGDPKILDFGLAKPLESIYSSDQPDSTQTVSEELTKVGKIMGTVSYMSPEQVRGEKVDTRSDIFAFGILLYRMVTGDLPFAGPTQVETMAKILESSFEPPTAKNEAIPQELERIITKCLRKDPEERYQSSRDLVVDLRNVRRQFDSGITDTVTQSGVTSAAPRRRPPWKRVAIAVVLVCVYFAIFGLPGGDDSSSQRLLQAKPNALAILGFENKTGDTDLDWLETGLPEILLTDLAQSQEVPIISQQRILDCFEADVKKSHTHDQCVKAAQSLGATRLLSGSYYKLGDKIRIDARLEDVGNGNIIMAEKVVGDDAFMLVDSLTAKMAAALNIERTGNLAALASSPEAYREYHAGMEQFWRSEYDSAIMRFEAAIELDSTFALPYMRIGLSQEWSGRHNQAVESFEKARLYEDRLPARERGMLDAYYDTWVTLEYDNAFAKMESQVKKYPDDAEIRVIYAMFLQTFRRDRDAAFAQLDTVLTTYPTNIFALEQYVLGLRRTGQLDSAATLVERLIEISPNAIQPRINLVRLRQSQCRWQEAYGLAEDLHERFPHDQRPLVRLISISIQLREFDRTREYAEALRDIDPDDPYRLTDYYNYMIALDWWRGDMKNLQKDWQSQVDAALTTGDSNLVYGAYSQISQGYRIFRDGDSSLYYATKANEWATMFNKLAYPMTIVSIDPSREPEIRPVFKEITDGFRASTPSEFWGVIDAIEKGFNGIAASDTSMIIESQRDVIELTSNSQSTNMFEMGQLLILTGKYSEGIECLERFVEGQYRSTSPVVYVRSVYYLALANEGLGNKEKAVTGYEEFLKFWGGGQFKFMEIDDARERLARLTS